MRWLIVVGCAVVLVVTGGGRLGSSVSLAREASTYTLLQMNLCLSGFSRCYGKVAYPAGVDEAVARIRDTHPDAVTLNETCQGDVRLRDRRAPRVVGSGAAGSAHGPRCPGGPCPPQPLRLNAVHQLRDATGYPTVA
jgi:hypothetical protein